MRGRKGRGLCVFVYASMLLCAARSEPVHPDFTQRLLDADLGCEAAEQAD